MAGKIRLVVGLANPGIEYANTRHNAGAWFVERLCELHTIKLSADKKLFGFSGKFTLDGEDCRLLIPTTFMNDSGQSVSAAAKYYEIEPETILVAHDELDLVPGDIRLKFSGGHGGHNGLRDIFKSLGQNFHRLRIGIGKPTAAGIEHVLGTPSKTERTAINAAIEEAINVVPDLLAGKIEAATKTLNSRG